MTLQSILAALCVVSVVLVLPVSADSWKDESGYGYQNNKHYKNKHMRKYVPGTVRNVAF